MQNLITRTYDLSTPVGQTRFHLADTDVDCATFADDEITYCLSLCDGDPMLAAAWALDALASDAARLAKVVKDAQGAMMDATDLSNTLHARATNLRDLAAAAPDLTAPLPVFTPDLNNGTFTGSMDGW